MYTIAAVFLIYIVGTRTISIPHLVNKVRPTISAGDASRTILVNALMAAAVYYTWQQQSHTQLREIFAIALGAVIAFHTIETVTKIHKRREVITANWAAALVTVNIALLVMVLYLVAT